MSRIRSAALIFATASCAHGPASSGQSDAPPQSTPARRAPPIEATPSDGPPSIALPPPLARVLRDYERAWRNGDASALAALFAADGYVLQNGRPPVQGQRAITRAYQGAGGPLSLRAFAFAVEGPVGYILGGFTAKPGAPDIGKFTLTLRQTAGGRWVIVSDMDNGNRPPLRQPPSM